MQPQGLRQEAEEVLRRVGARIKEELHFFKGFATNPRRVGAVSPSGRSLAQAVAAEIDPSWEGLFIELGPGTGSVTAALLERGVPPSRLVAIEYDPDFAAGLQSRFPEVRVLTGDAFKLQELLLREGMTSVAAIISGIPLLSYPVPRRRALLEEAMALLPVGRPLVQFSYGFVPPLPAERGRWSLHVSDWIWRNFPPARVFTYRKSEEWPIVVA